MSEQRRLPRMRSSKYWTTLEERDKKEALNAVDAASREQKSNHFLLNIIQGFLKASRGNWGLGVRRWGLEVGDLQGLVTKHFVW
jgi:hypothetical protein